jgi:hypothetical protein
MRIAGLGDRPLRPGRTRGGFGGHQTPESADGVVALTGPDGLLKVLTRTVIETALDVEMAEYTWLG